MFPEDETQTIDTGTDWTPNRKVLAGAVVAVVAFAVEQFGLDLGPVIPSLTILVAAYLIPERS